MLTAAFPYINYTLNLFCFLVHRIVFRVINFLVYKEWWKRGENDHRKLYTVFLSLHACVSPMLNVLWHFAPSKWLAHVFSCSFFVCVVELGQSDWQKLFPSFIKEKDNVFHLKWEQRQPDQFWTQLEYNGDQGYASRVSWKTYMGDFELALQLAWWEGVSQPCVPQKALCQPVCCSG